MYSCKWKIKASFHLLRVCSTAVLSLETDINSVYIILLKMGMVKDRQSTLWLTKRDFNYSKKNTRIERTTRGKK